jgi:hypothetical protein
VEGIVAEGVDGVEGREDEAVEVGLGEVERAPYGSEVCSVGVVVVVVEAGGLGEVFWGSRVSWDMRRGELEGGETLQKVHWEEVLEEVHDGDRLLRLMCGEGGAELLDCRRVWCLS